MVLLLDSQENYKILPFDQENENFSSNTKLNFLKLLIKKTNLTINYNNSNLLLEFYKNSSSYWWWWSTFFKTELNFKEKFDYLKNLVFDQFDYSTFWQRLFQTSLSLIDQFFKSVENNFEFKIFVILFSAFVFLFFLILITSKLFENTVYNFNKIKGIF